MKPTHDDGVFAKHIRELLYTHDATMKIQQHITKQRQQSHSQPRPHKHRNFNSSTLSVPASEGWEGRPPSGTVPSRRRPPLALSNQASPEILPPLPRPAPFGGMPPSASRRVDGVSDDRFWMHAKIAPVRGIIPPFLRRQIQKS